MGETGFFSSPVGLGVLALVAGFSLVAVAKFYGLIFMRWKTPFRVGETMSVRRAEVVEWENGPDGGEGHVRAGGELWRATSTDNLSPGEAVQITEMNGLELRVSKK